MGEGACYQEINLHETGMRIELLFGYDGVCCDDVRMCLLCVRQVFYG